MMRPSRLLLCDHLLRGSVGHHLGYNLALADAALRAGVPVELLTHREFDPALAAGHPVRRIFRTDRRFDPPAWIACNQRLLGGLAAWSKFRFGRDLVKLPQTGSLDALFAQMLAPRHFCEWLTWFRKHADNPVLFLHLGYAPEKFSAREIVRALHRMPPKQKRRLFLVTDSEKLVPAFEGILKVKVHHLPHIISYGIPSPVSRRGADPLVVFAPGNARREKGFHEVFRAVGSLAGSEESRNIRFVLQCHDPDPACSAILKDGPPPMPGVEWIPGVLSDEEYTRRLVQADVILIPYHLDQYSKRTSGIFCEARVAGKPVITTRESWAGDRVEREGGGWLVAEKDADSLTNVLRALAEEFSSRSTEAVALSLQARQEFHRDNFMMGMLDLFSLAA
jgi:glycosyltransferase involved in cell wall biosynthesis